ncbi:MAG: hypothetical protein A2X12_10340 [Bacteroidetes bacterium GWE2_29_8]|nr:MAG: hypothetical protein A2X12_10340 [Bacteroidetes bacterium GWE2_29_8]OFY14837.1 MAG: hypothetical protein A2X02_06275 [Bacteroidetes bacterium GWF2_29_10]
MQNWSGKSKGGLFGYSFFIFLIKYTHIRVAYFFLKIVAFYFLFFSDKHSIKYYFREIHGLKGFRVLKSIYDNYCMLGEILIDKMYFMFGYKNNFTFDYEGESHLLSMSNNGHGGMLIGAHMGNWEIAGNLLERVGCNINIVIVEAEHEKIKSLLKNSRISKKINIIPIKDDFSHLFKISSAFENNELVVMHGDRFIGEANTVVVDFMGKPAKFPTGPLYIASKHKVPVSFVYTLKEKPSHYHFYATSPKIFEYPSNLKTRQKDMKHMVGLYVSSLENIVKKYPNQWFNYYPFWEEEKNKL